MGGFSQECLEMQFGVGAAIPYHGRTVRDFLELKGKTESRAGRHNRPEYCSFWQ
jgi:hypothetical protein